MGRSVVSAYDYMEWVKEKMSEAAKTGKLNPVDATMIAQITPGELQKVNHALEFAKDLVREWLYTYKFSDWKKTSTHKIDVTEEMKKARANKVADEFANHSRWRTHGRSLKISDLEDIGLTVRNLDETPEIADLVYRIQFVCKLILETTSIYKLFFDAQGKIVKTAVAANIQNNKDIKEQGKPQVVQIEIKCEKCGRNHKLYKKLSENALIDMEMQKNNVLPLPEEDFIKCECENIIDLKAIKNEIEMAIK